MNDCWIRYVLSDEEYVMHFKDVECVISDGQMLWVDTFHTPRLAAFPMKLVREVSGTELAVVS